MGVASPPQSIRMAALSLRRESTAREPLSGSGTLIRCLSEEKRGRQGQRPGAEGRCSHSQGDVQRQSQLEMRKGLLPSGQWCAYKKW